MRLAEPTLAPSCNCFALFLFDGSLKVTQTLHVCKNPGFWDLALKSAQRWLNAFIFPYNHLGHAIFSWAWTNNLDDWAYPIKSLARLVITRSQERCVLSYLDQKQYCLRYAHRTLITSDYSVNRQQLDLPTWLTRVKDRRPLTKRSLSLTKGDAWAAKLNSYESSHSVFYLREA